RWMRSLGTLRSRAHDPNLPRRVSPAFEAAGGVGRGQGKWKGARWHADGGLDAKAETNPDNRQGRSRMAYHLEGRLLEVCDCRVLCPCWIGEDPDNGTCDSLQAWHFDAGTIEGIDVTGRTIAMVAHIPGNVLKGNFRVALYVDEGASDKQQEAIL